MLTQWLTAYHEQHRAYDEAWEVDAPPAPAFFEVSFGMALREGADPHLSREEPLEISVAGVTVKLSGRIDRIDVGQARGQEIFNVVDYKSGRPHPRPKDATLDGTSLQLELYTIAVQDMLLSDRGAVPWEAGYWHLKEKGYRAWFALHESEHGRPKAFVDWETRRREVYEKVAALVAGIRAAQFPVYSLDEKCTGMCPYHTVCRINQVRSLEKEWPET
jgi:ATP-dependent helicase/DNAse subunit B